MLAAAPCSPLVLPSPSRAPHHPPSSFFPLRARSYLHNRCFPIMIIIQLVRCRRRHSLLLNSSRQTDRHTHAKSHTQQNTICSDATSCLLLRRRRLLGGGRRRQRGRQRGASQRGRGAVVAVHRRGERGRLDGAVVVGAAGLAGLGEEEGLQVGGGGALLFLGGGGKMGC